MRIALAQMNPVLGDFAANVQNALDLAASAKRAGADLVLFPAYALTGAWADNLLDSDAFAADARRALESFAVSVPVPSVMGAVIPSPAGGGVLAAAHCSDGAVTVLGCTDDAGEDAFFAECSIGTLPVVKVDGVSCAVALDYQLTSGFSDAMMAGASVLLVCSAESYDGAAAEGEARGLRRRTAALAVEHHLHLGYCNLVGGCDDAVFDGGSFVLASDGALVAGGFRFDEMVVLADIDPTIQAPTPGLIADKLSAEEADWSALVLATRDYVRKSGFTDVIVGLSGGIDSAVVATIAVDALGADNVHGVLMPGPFSSVGSIDDALRLAANLSVDTVTVPVSGPLDALTEVLAEACGGEVRGVAYENLQARIRGVYLMTLANATDALVLNTGNKSEAAMGYSTLHGDTVGAFAPLADVYKTRVYELARWRSALGASIPVESMEKAPSAELRPDHRDVDSLPADYDLLDRILTLHVENGLGVAAIVEMGFDRPVVTEVLRRVSAAEYKRQLEPLGPSITKADFGSGHVWPIVNRWVDRG